MTLTPVSNPQITPSPIINELLGLLARQLGSEIELHSMLEFVAYSTAKVRVYMHASSGTYIICFVDGTGTCCNLHVITESHWLKKGNLAAGMGPCLIFRVLQIKAEKLWESGTVKVYLYPTRIDFEDKAVTFAEDHKSVIFSEGSLNIN